MRERRLLLLFLVVIALGHAAQASFFEDAKNFFQGLWSKLKEKFNSLRESWKEKFPNLSAKIKQWLNLESFHNASAADLLSDIPSDGWKEMEPAMLLTASAEEMTKLVELKDEKVPARFLQELDRLITSNQSREDLLTQAKNDLNKMSLVEAETVMQALGDPNQWTSGNITFLDIALLNMPYCLEKITEADLRKTLLTIVDKCRANTSPTGCPGKATASDIKERIMMTKMGHPSQWTAGLVVELGGAPAIPETAINALPENLVVQMLPDIKKLPFNVNDVSKNEKWKQQLCKAEKCKDLTKATVNDWYVKLGNAKARITPSDVPEAALDQETVLGELLDHVKELGDKCTAMDADRILKRVLTGKTPETMTQTEINETEGHMMVHAPACFLKEGASRNILGGVLTQATQSLQATRGPEFKAKTGALMEANMKEALKDGTFNPTVVKEPLKPFISAKLLSNQGESILKQVANAAKTQNIQMGEDQIDAIQSKVSVSNAKDFPSFVRDFISTSTLKTMSQKDLEKLIEDMDPLSLPCLKGAKIIFSGKTTISATDVGNNKKFLKCMSAADALKVPSNDLFKTFKQIGDSALSPAACRVLAMKVEDWAAMELSDPDDVWENMYVDEIATLPPCIIADYGKFDLSKLSGEAQRVVLRRLCKNEGYFMISMENRRTLLNSLLARMLGTSGISTCDMEMLGPCALDLNADLQKRMDVGAQAKYITQLQEELKKGTGLCLDSSQREGVAMILENVKGEPSSWKSAADVSCLLDTLTSPKLSSIPDAVLNSAACPRMISSFDTTIPGDCMMSMEKAKMELMDRQIDRCINMRDKAGFKSKCDVISCSGVRMMSASELSSLTPDEVLVELEDLTPDDLPMDKAKTLLAKIKEKKELKDLTVDDMSRLGSLWKAMTTEDVKNLPTFTYANSKVAVFQIGRMKDIPKNTMMALANKVTTEFREPAAMSSQDLVLVGQLLCVMPKETLAAIKNDAFLKAMRNLGKLDCGDIYQTSNLSMKAVDAYVAAEGAIETWEPAVVAEMNRLLGGMAPEKVMNIPAPSFSGLTPTAMKSLSTDTMKALSKDHITNLSVSAAIAISSDQMNALTPDIRAALTSLRPKKLESGGLVVMVSRSLLVIALLVVATLA